MTKSSKNKPASEKFVLTLADELHVQMEQKFERVEQRFERMEQRMEENEKKHDERHHKIMETLTWLVSQFKRFDEEHTVLAHQVSKHDDRISKLEKVTFRSS